MKFPIPAALNYEAAQAVGATCLGLRVQTASRLISSRYDAVFRELDLTCGQFSTLMMMNRPKKLTVAQLATALCMDLTTVNVVLSELEGRRLIEISLDEVAPRVRRVGLTEDGSALLSAAVPYWKSANDGLLARLSEAQQDTLWKAFDILREMIPGGPTVGDFPEAPKEAAMTQPGKNPTFA